MPLSKADPPAGGGTLPWGQDSGAADGTEAGVVTSCPWALGCPTPEEVHCGIKAGFCTWQACVLSPVQLNMT